MRNQQWLEEFSRGDAGTFHQRDLPADLQPTVWWFEVDRPALVLGSSQLMGQVDLAECARRGVEVIRRRSGGGAVLLLPDESLWVDVLIPADHPQWTNDVGRSTWWLGEVWLEALEQCGLDGLAVHRGPMMSTAWSAHVCFAGVGGGEVLRGSRKVVGISQRRTRAGARFQCCVHHRWRPEAHPPLFVQPGPTTLDLRDAAVEVHAETEALRVAFMRCLRAAAEPSTTIPH